MAGAKWGQLQDPVCRMMVKRDSYPLTHLHIRYAFCSERCRERFIKWPHLFIGDPAHGFSEKQKGRVVRKTQQIKLVNPPGREKESKLKNAIGSLMGVESVDIRGSRIVVVYDLVQVSLRDIEQATIAEAGDLKTGIIERIRLSIIHYCEECELDNLAHLASHYRP